MLVLIFFFICWKFAFKIFDFTDSTIDIIFQNSDFGVCIIYIQNINVLSVVIYYNSKSNIGPFMNVTETIFI